MVEILCETAKFSVLIDGTPSSFFQSKRGMRQRGSSFRFWFILAMGRLSDMLRTFQINN